MDAEWIRLAAREATRGLGFSASPRTATRSRSKSAAWTPGDNDQTIYQWRGSAVANILTFTQRQAGVRTVTLYDNFRSSRGIVSLAREVAARNDPHRLPKNMAAAGHHAYDRGDMLALTFDSAADEAAWICDRMGRLRGVPFVGAPGAEPRGLSWPDCAMLFRSVSKDAGELAAGRRPVPYVIKGLARLFDAPGVQACVACFQYVLREKCAEEVVSAWLAADAGVTRDALLAPLPTAIRS